jgi:hypothetical protein
MRLSLLLFPVIMASCVSQLETFKPPSGDITLIHDRGGKDRRPAYRIYSGDGRVLGQVRSIIDAETVNNVPGLPVNQQVIWSPSGKTALIYENMSDASPAYQHLLIRVSPDSQSFRAYKVDLGTRHSSPEDIYGQWPSVSRISDSVIELDWASEPKNEKVEVAKFLSDSDPISEQGVIPNH